MLESGHSNFELFIGEESDLLREIILEALGKIGDPKAVEPLVDRLKRTNDHSFRGDILRAIGKIDLVYLYDFLDDSITLSIFCKFSLEYGMRFFRNRIILPTGDILWIRNREEKKKACERLRNFLKHGEI